MHTTSINMKNTIIATIVLLLLPVFSFAMTISVTPPEDTVRVGDTVILKVMIDTEQVEINAVDGVIYFNKSAPVTSLTTGGSIMSLWPKVPTIEDNKITFTGGSPSGVFGKFLKIFTIAIKPTTADTIEISIPEGHAYLNDGQGTEVGLTGPTINIPVLPRGDDTDNLASLIGSDTEPPTSFTIEIGREASLYDGKYFLSFYSSDGESGIEYYEVTENNYSPVRSGNVYVLKNQNLSGTVTVKAVDVAGNVRTETRTLGMYDSEVFTPTLITISAILILVLVSLYLFIVKRK